MVRRKLTEAMNTRFKRLVEDYYNKEWEINQSETTKFYKYIFEDVKSARKIWIPHTLSGVGLEIFDEVKFNDGSTHYFWNNGGKVNEGLSVREYQFSNEALREIDYLD